MRHLRAAIGPTLLFVLVTGFYWKLLTRQYTWMDQPDMAHQVLPWYQFQAKSWQNGEFPLWDPHVWGGQPLLGQMQPGAAYPLNWPLFLLPLKDGHINQLWLRLYFILNHVLAAWFCYWLCLDLGRSRWAAMLGGLGFALSGMVGALGWPQMLNGAIWAPLPVLFFLRAQRGRQPVLNASLAGAILGLSFLAGHHQIPTFLAWMMAGLWIHELWRRRLAALRPMLACLLFAGLVSAFQILPALEYGIHSIRWVGSQNAIFWGQYVPYAVHEQPAHSLFPLGLLGLVLPNLSPHETFVGLGLLALAVAGITYCFQQLEVRLLGCIGLGGVVVALGGFSVFHGIAYLVLPLMEKARTPAMALVLVQFAVAVLAAYGLDALRTRPPERWWAPAFALLGVLPWPALALLSAVRPEQSREYERIAVAALVALAIAALLHGLRVRQVTAPTATALAVLLVLFELGSVMTSNFRHREDPGGYLSVLEQNRDLAGYLRGLAEPVRLEVDTDAVPYNFGDWEGIDQFRAYLGGMTTNVAPLEQERLRGGDLAVRLFALNYFLGKAPSRDGQVEVMRAQSGLRLYRNGQAFPRAWLVHRAQTVPAPDLTARLAGVDLRHEVVLPAGAPALEQCDGDAPVRLLRRGNTHVLLETNAACRAMMILSETNSPGWVARVDGQEAAVHNAYGVLRGVVVEAGTHQVEFVYRPRSAYWGALLSFSGGLGILALWLRGRRTVTQSPDGEPEASQPAG